MPKTRRQQLALGSGFSPEQPDVFLPLREKIEWGYIIPYMISGILNEHPRIAIALRQDPEKRDKYAEFYRTMTTPECYEAKVE